MLSKKILISLLIILFALSSFSVYASTTPYTDEEMQISFTLPDGWHQSPLSKDRDILRAKFENTNYGFGMITYNAADLWAAMSDDEKTGLDRSDLDSSFFTVDYIAEAYQVNTSDINILSHGGYNYYHFLQNVEYSSSGIELSTVSPVAVCFNDGYVYIFQLYFSDYDSYFSDFISLLDTVSYTSVAKQNTSTSVYTDDDADVSFTVPANWSQSAVSTDSDTLKVEFVSDTTNNASIFYARLDMYSNLSESDRQYRSRSEINNSLFTKDDIASYANCDPEQIETVSYASVEYFKASPEHNDAIDGHFVVLIHVENGYYYIFIFQGYDTDPLYADFEALLNSAVYPSNSSSAVTEANSEITTILTSGNTATDNTNTDKFLSLVSPKIVLYSLAISGILSVLLFLFAIYYFRRIPDSDKSHISREGILSSFSASYAYTLFLIFLFCLSLYIFFIVIDDAMVNPYSLNNPLECIFSTIAYVIFYRFLISIILRFSLRISTNVFDGFFYRSIFDALLVFIIISLAFSLTNVIMYHCLFYLVIGIVQLLCAYLAFKKSLIKTAGYGGIPLIFTSTVIDVLIRIILFLVLFIELLSFLIK